MNKLLIGSASLLCLLTAFAPITKAEMGASEKPTNTRIEEYNQETQTSPNNQTDSNSQMSPDSNNSSSNSNFTEPFSLVSLAYRGQFKEQGIPGYNAFITKYATGQVTAEKLVEAAIKADRLSSQAMNDESYINAVELQLRNLRQGI